ncbi:hypothetical protein [Pseudomonas canadensis]|uniref:Uncharacterized protein n=1 Tax=Pseudomonas canadensis TaxID=915099 RepID=A0ABZ1A9C1_9PSED|nr:hypothetical protein [Pseudomonas canadensis]WRI25171.1 hypothetical protein SPL95_02275 [Pseudomonas canadensis]
MGLQLRTEDSAYTYLQCYSTNKGKCGNGSIRIEQTEAFFKEILTNVESMSLILGKSAEIRKSLEVAEGHFRVVADKQQQGH